MILNLIGYSEFAGHKVLYREMINSASLTCAGFAKISVDIFLVENLILISGLRTAKGTTVSLSLSPSFLIDRVAESEGSG